MADTGDTQNPSGNESKTPDAGSEGKNAGDAKPNNADAGGDDAGKSIVGDAGQPKGGEDKGEPDASGKTKDAKTGAPEKYEPFKVPEGLTVDETMSKTFMDKAKAMNLTQAQAQELVDFQAQLVSKQFKESEETYKQMRSEWAEASKKMLGADPEKSLALVAKGRDAFATPELVKFLGESGLGDHPEVIRLFAKIGSAIAEDTVVDGGKGGGTKTLAQILYPDQSK